MSNKKMMLGVFLVALSVSCTEEGAKDKRDACNELASPMAACDPNMTEDEWLDVCAMLVFSPDCLDAMKKAPCEDHNSDEPSYQELCFPSCDPGETEPSCDGDSILRCVDDGYILNTRCDYVCEVNDGIYGGICSSELNGQQSSSGGDVCWCHE